MSVRLYIHSYRSCLSLAILVSTFAFSFAIACGDDDDDGGDDAGTVKKEGDAGSAGDAETADAADTVETEGDASSEGDAEIPDDAPLVEIDDGKIRGEMVGGARRFLKIPYAKPPVGELRWKAPVKNDPWTGERFETEFVENCPQLEDQGSPPSENEDCLYLNVWSPNPAPDRAPVMVWIHGGGNFSGGAGIPIPVMGGLWFDGQYFAANNGVVLVTTNYRLGPFGFFSHPALAEEGEPVGNQGLRDQQMALQWVQENIAAFGGDPENVTIFGESAGSADVCYHVASPGSRGLFHRAISESGGCTVGRTGNEKTPEERGQSMVAFGEAVGCDAGEDQLDCLREASVEDILANSNQPSPGAGETFSTGDWSFAAVLDGSDDFLPGKLKELFDRGEIAKVPYMLGSNNDEGTTFVWRAESLVTEEDYRAYLEDNYGDLADEVFALYPPSDFDGNYDAARARVVGDSLVVCSTHDTARRAAKAGLTVFMYNFNVWWSLLPDVMRAGHASEISHVFGSPYVPEGQDPSVTEESQMVADAMNTYWARFAATGDPNGPDAPAQWPEFDPDNDQRLQLDSSWEVLQDFRKVECEFWRDYYGVD